MDIRTKRSAATWWRGIRRRVLALGGGMLLLAAGLAHANTVTYVYTDPQGTPLAEANASGTITATYDYAPYGSQAMGAAHDGPGYTGHVNDADTGLVYMQARYYDPVVGRFISTDPDGLAAGNSFNFNRYAYANNNPIVNMDPDGRRSRIAWLVELSATGMKKVAHLTMEQAVRARQQGKNILAARRQLSSQIETAAHGREGQLKHAAHELEDSSKGLPHYQTENKVGHTFWGKASVVLTAVGAGLDRAADAAEYIPDPVPRLASKDDVTRANNIIGIVNKATGLNIPKYNNDSKNNSFQGVFEVHGRLDSIRLNKELDGK